MPAEYDEVRIRYWGVGEGGYFVLACGAACARALIDVVDPERFHRELEKLVEQEYRGDERPADEHVRRRLKEVGKRLTEYILPKEIEKCFEANLTLARKYDRKLRLRFVFPPALQNIPIEILRPGDTYVSLRQDISIARSHGDAASFGVPRREPVEKITLVLAGASPKGPDPINLTEGAERIAQALVFEADMGLIEIPKLRARTRSALHALLASIPGPCVVVIIAHGNFDDDAGEGVVFLEHEDGNAEPVNEEELAGLMTAARDLRFVSLNLCHGGKADIRSRNYFSGVAGRLIANGVPIVMASQFATSDAIDRFTGDMLVKICSGSWIDSAAAAARVSAGPADAGPVDWCVPALHLHESCFTTQLLLPPKPGAKKETAPTTSIDAARDRVRHARSFETWRTALNFAEGALRTNEKDPVLLALQSEAFVEVNVVGRCRDACLALEQGNPSAAIQTLDRIPADHSHLVKPLRDLACSRIDRHNGARTPAADYNWESAKQNRSLDFIGRE